MLRPISLLLAGLLAAVPAAALAAEPVQIDCPLDGLSAAEFDALAENAASVVYLASDEAAYVTGQTLHVNGGMAMI